MQNWRRRRNDKSSSSATRKAGARDDEGKTNGATKKGHGGAKTKAMAARQGRQRRQNDICRTGVGAMTKAAAVR